MKKEISFAIKSFWQTRQKQGSVLAGKQLDAFLALLKKKAVEAGVPSECVYLKNNHVPGYFRASKDWDLLIYENLSDNISIESFISSFQGFLSGVKYEFK